MGYIEDYFHKEINQIVDTDIVSFIAQNIQENLTLDYKDFRKYDDPVDLSRIIGSFANSVGGLLILGISERDNFPDSITWGDLRGKSRESLENKLLSQIYPKIHNLRIIPIYKSGSTTTGIYLIDIPQGENPPYMSGDNKYYRRLNFQKRPMEGYEVADFFGRRKRPRLSIVPILDHFPIHNINESSMNTRWNVNVKNIGKSLAKDLLFIIKFSHATVTNHSLQFNLRCDGSSVSGYFAFPDKPPIYPHPSLEFFLGIVDFSIPIQASGQIDTQISYELLSENTPIIKGSFILSSHRAMRRLEITDIKEDEIKDW